MTKNKSSLEQPKAGTQQINAANSPNTEETGSKPVVQQSNLQSDNGRQAKVTALQTVLRAKMSAEANHTKNDKLSKLGDAITFSEALERTNYGIFNYFVIIITGLILAGVFLESSSVAYFMTVAHCDLQLTNYRKGLLSAISYVGMIISSHLWGFLADTKGRRRVMRPTLIAGFVVTVISSFATNFWVMLVLRFINGIFVSGASATSFVYLSEFHSDRTRSKAMMISSFIFAIGAVFLPALSFAVINREWRLPLAFMGLLYKPWRLFIIVCGLPGLICGITLYFLPETPKFLLSINKEEETKEVLQQMYRTNGGKDKLELPHIIADEGDTEATDDATEKSSNMFGFLTTMWNQTAPLFWRKHLRATTIVCTAQFWFYVITNGLYMWFPYIVNAMVEFMKSNPGENRLLCQVVYDKHEKLDMVSLNSTLTECTDKLENTTYIYSLILEIVYVSTFAIITVIINRVSKITIMVVISIFCSVCGLAAVWVPYISISAIFYVVFFVGGISINVLGAVTVELYPTHLRAMAMCVSLMMGRIGSVVGTNIVGALLASHCELTFYIACVAMLACAVLILFLPRSITAEKTQAAEGMP